MKTVRILILEDDLETLSFIFKKLYLLEEEVLRNNPPVTFSTVALSEYTQVEDYINNKDDFVFDIVLLDRDCKIGGSFHILDVERLGPEKVIAISSTPPYNDDARKRGVKRVVFKDYKNLDAFSNKLITEIKDLLFSNS